MMILLVAVLPLVLPAPATALPAACNPPLPSAGQTVTWTPALNPVQICADATIPAGAVVELAPGVQLEVLAGATLTVDGELNGLGNVASPLWITGAGDVQVNGRATFDQATVDVDVGRASRSVVRVSNAVVPVGSDLSSTSRDALLELENVVVQSGVPTVYGQLAMRGVEFSSPGFLVDWTGYFLADGVTIHGAPLTVVADHQPRLLSDVDVSNPGNQPALIVDGGGVTPGTNVLIEGTCDLSGGSFPVKLRVGGLHPESVVPTFGNARNAVDIGGFNAGSGVCDWPNLGIPYYAAEDVSIDQGRARPEGGAIFEFETFVNFEVRGGFFNDTGCLRGEPGNPIFVRPATPGIEHAGVALFNATAEHIDVEAGRLSSIAGFNAIRECTVRNSSVGVFGDASGFGTVRGCRILNNVVGAEDDPSSSTSIDLDGFERPNVFEGNQTAAANNASPSGSTGPFPAAGNWWGDTTGPQSPWINPTGLGDPIGFGVQAAPWRTSPPDLSDRPPYVTLEWPFLLAEPGDAIYVHWNVEDDGVVVSQRILMDVSGGGNFNWVVVAAGLSGAQRSAFVDVPFVGANSDARSTLLRVEATDDAGQVGVHDITLQVPVQNRPDGTVQFTTDTSSGFAPGQQLPICYDALGVSSGAIRIYVVMDTEENLLQWGPNGWAGLGSCTFSSLRFARVSTNRARFALFADGIGNDNDWYFSEPFEIRPLPEFPDAPPQVTMQTPLTGQRFQGGEVVPIAWQASDDEGLREFRIQVSLNDGRAWSTVDTVAGSARTYPWQLPALTRTLDAVRVRVVAVDHRFQSTADGDERVLAFDPGQPFGVDAPQSSSGQLGTATRR